MKKHFFVRKEEPYTIKHFRFSSVIMRKIPLHSIFSLEDNMVKAHQTL